MAKTTSSRPSPYRFETDFRIIREARCLTIDQVHRRTMLQPETLYAFEESGLFDHPVFASDVHRRFFVKNYAKAVGIDEGDALQALRDATGGTYDGFLVRKYLGIEPVPATSQPPDDSQADWGMDVLLGAAEEPKAELEVPAPPAEPEPTPSAPPKLEASETQASKKPAAKPELPVAKSPAAGPASSPKSAPEPETKPVALNAGRRKKAGSSVEAAFLRARTRIDQGESLAEKSGGPSPILEPDDELLAPPRRTRVTTPPKREKLADIAPPPPATPPPTADQPDLLRPSRIVETPVEANRTPAAPELAPPEPVPDRPAASETGKPPAPTAPASRTPAVESPYAPPSEPVVAPVPSGAGIQNEVEIPDDLAAGEAEEETVPLLRPPSAKSTRTRTVREAVVDDTKPETSAYQPPDIDEVRARTSAPGPKNRPPEEREAIAPALVMGVLAGVLILAVAGWWAFSGGSAEAEAGDAQATSIALSELPSRFSGFIRPVGQDEQFISLKIRSVPDAEGQFDYTLWRVNDGRMLSEDGNGEINAERSRIRLSQVEGWGTIMRTSDGSLLVRSTSTPEWELKAAPDLD